MGSDMSLTRIQTEWHASIYNRGAKRQVKGGVAIVENLAADSYHRFGGHSHGKFGPTLSLSHSDAHIGHTPLNMSRSPAMGLEPLSFE